MGEQRKKEAEKQSGEVLHGGKGDPLGGGVSKLEPSEEVTEGEPEQDQDDLQDRAGSD